jgi:hypothetical protein
MKVNELIDLPDGNADILFQVDGIAYDVHSVQTTGTFIYDGVEYNSYEEMVRRKGYDAEQYTKPCFVMKG